MAWKLMSNEEIVQLFEPKNIGQRLRGNKIVYMFQQTGFEITSANYKLKYGKLYRRVK